MIEPVSASGSQRMFVSVAFSAGSAGKSQTPLLAGALDQPRRVDRSQAKVSIVALIVFVAPQPFPSNLGRRQMVDIVVAR